MCWASAMAPTKLKVKTRTLNGGESWPAELAGRRWQRADQITASSTCPAATPFSAAGRRARKLGLFYTHGSWIIRCQKGEVKYKCQYCFGGGGFRGANRCCWLCMKGKTGRVCVGRTNQSLCTSRVTHSHHGTPHASHHIKKSASLSRHTAICILIVGCGR